MAVTPRDKLLLASAALLVAASAGVFGTLVWRAADLAPVPAPELNPDPYAARIESAETPKPETWNAPSAQSRGREWIFDTFTPPEIFYNSKSRQFTVKPPAAFTEGMEPEEAFGLELVAVRPEPFRLQLIGYVGQEGNWRGTFQNVASGEVFLARSGAPVAKLGLAIESFDVVAQPVALAPGVNSRQRVATAVVRDDRTGQRTTLTHRERALSGTINALVAAEGQSATREVRQGDVFKSGEATYRVERVQLTPPQVELVKESPKLSQPDRRVLTPREAEERPEGVSP